MKKVKRIDKSTIADLMKLVPEQVDRDDMAIPSYLHGNPLINWIFWRRLDTVYNLLPPGRLQSVLDYGCGVGTILPSLAEKCDHVYGCDKRPSLAQALTQRLQLKNVTVLDVPAFYELPDASLDVVTSADVLEHVDNLGELVATFHRKLKPTGCLIVSGPTENPLYRLGRKIAGFSGDYHVRTIFDIDAEIEQQSFKRETMRTLPVGMMPAGLSLFMISRFVK